MDDMLCSGLGILIKHGFRNNPIVVEHLTLFFGLTAVLVKQESSGDLYIEVTTTVEASS